MSTQEITSTNNVQGLSTSAKNQYALWQIVGIWLAGGTPMWLLGWIVYPAMSIGLSPVDAGLLRIKLLTVGLIWQFALAMIILYCEEGNYRLSTISRRFWLNHPVSAKTALNDRFEPLRWWLESEPWKKWGVTGVTGLKGSSKGYLLSRWRETLRTPFLVVVPRLQDAE